MTPNQTDEGIIVVDYQNGFVPVAEWGTGELWVEGWWRLASRINELIKITKSRWGLVIGTRDMHPQWHMSFASNYDGKDPFDIIWVNDIAGLELSPAAEFDRHNLVKELWNTWEQILWPDHCIVDTPSSWYHESLERDLIDVHIEKWYVARKEAYSWFDGKEQRENPKVIVKLVDVLRNAWIETVKVVGLATDYCVNATVLDALKEWFNVQVFRDAIAGVSPEKSIKKLEALREKWVKIL